MTSVFRARTLRAHVAKKRTSSARSNSAPHKRVEPTGDATGEWRVVIETPRGSRNKYTFDEAIGTFELTGVMPEGMSFPYDFGYVPKTLGGDGDPLDVLVLMDEPAFTGCVVVCRWLGVIEAEQTERDGRVERNDRLLAVAINARADAAVRSIDDLGEARVRALCAFFENYNDQKGKRFNVLRVAGPREAVRIVREGMKRYARKSKRSGR